ncbi:MAG: formate/nitrite transporter family protein [archaeon]
MPDFKDPTEIWNDLVKVGVAKTKLKVNKLIVLAVMAGIFIAIGSALFTAVTQDILLGESIGMISLVGGIVFSVGLMMVVFAGSELFTGNNLIVISALAKKSTWRGLLKNWVWVFIGNFIGSLIMVFIMYHSGLVTGAVAERAIAIAQSKISLTWIEALMRGVLCNFLVVLAIAFASGEVDEISGKIFGILFPIMAFVALGYEHSVANMYFVPMGIFLDGGISWGAFFIKNLIPVTIGNIIGGSIFVSAVYWYVYVKKGGKK